MTVYKEKNFISSVVYVNNDEARIADFLTMLYDFFDANFSKFEIICVDDSSSDNSASLIKQTAANMNGRVTLLNMSYFQGLEAAMNAGIDLAIGDFVFEFDSCFPCFPVDTIRKVYDKCLEGHDIVAAKATKQRITSRIFYYIYNHNAITQYRLESETFRILSRRAINRIHSISTYVPYRKAIYANCGLKLFSVPYQGIEVDHGSFSKRQRLSRRTNGTNTLILYTDVAYKLSIFMAIIMMLAAIGGAVYTITVYALGHPISGYTTTMLVMTGSFFGVFAILAIILKYLSLLIELVFRKQRYLIESIEKIK